MSDEYETTFRLTPATSERTLTLRELIGLIDTVESDIGVRDGFVETWLFINDGRFALRTLALPQVHGATELAQQR